MNPLRDNKSLVASIREYNQMSPEDQTVFRLKGGQLFSERAEDKIKLGLIRLNSNPTNANHKSTIFK